MLALPSPWPRNPHTGRNRNPLRYSGTTSTSAWATTPSVALPASSVIMSDVHASGGSPPSGNPPKMTRKATRPAIAITLLTAGAHMYGPKMLRAFRT